VPGRESQIWINVESWASYFWLLLSGSREPYLVYKPENGFDGRYWGGRCLSTLLCQGALKTRGLFNKPDLVVFKKFARIMFTGERQRVTHLSPQGDGQRG
jgi:hypothetical protein